MSFVYPAFLWALGAMAVPVLIHLFSFRKTQRVYFSSNRFLRQVQQATSSKRKLKHYLILASRLLFLMFLVLTFAQPFIPASQQVSAMRQITIYLDNSLSMSVPVQEKVRALDAAVSYAQQLVNAFPADTRYQVLTNDFTPFSNSYKAKEEVLDLLAQIRLSPVGRSAAEIAGRLKSAATPGREVFWISDFQRSTLGNLSPELFPDSVQRIHLVPLTLMTQANIFVDTAYLDNPFMVGGERNKLHVKLRNDGVKPVDQLLIKISLNEIQAGTATVAIPAKGETITTFELVTGLTPFTRVVISFNDYPVAFDNEFFVALNFSEKIKVIEIKPAPEITVVEKVYGNKAVFDFRSYNAGNFNYSTLQDADLVVLHGLDRIDIPLQQALKNYVTGGGCLLIIPSANPNLKDYQDLLALPSLNTIAESGKTELSAPDFSNPFFEHVFEERTTRLALPAAQRVLDWKADRSAVLKLKNDLPFLSRFSRKGLIYILASPLTAQYTDFAGNFLFLPVMYRIAASGKKTEGKPYYLLSESLITLRTDTLAGEQPVRLVGKQEIIPSQRRAAGRLFLELPRFSMDPGFYFSMHQADTLRLFAFNQNRQESLLEQLPVQAVKEQLGNGAHLHIFEANSVKTFSNEIKARYLGTPLWKYALVLALLFLLVEVLLIRFLK